MTFDSLRQSLPSPVGAKKLEDYYNGEGHLDALGVSLPPEVRILEMVTAWPAMAVDILAEVLTFIGFTLGEETDDDERLDFLSRAFQANNMDTQIPLAVLESLVQGNGFYLVGQGEKYPRITVHEASSAAIGRDAFGQVDEAVVRWSAEPGSDGRRLTHYYAGTAVDYRRANGRWEPFDTRDTGVSGVPIVPQPNRMRIRDKHGRSELSRVLQKVSDAGARTLTNLQVAQELEALPKRWIFANGIEELFKDQVGADGKIVPGKTKLDAYMGYLNVGPEGGSVQQLAGASLDPIMSNYKLYAQIISSMTGIPPSMLGISTDNPASAEAMRVAKDRLSSRGEAKQNMFGDNLEDLGRVVLEMGGHSTDGLEALQTVWRDVATPSKGSQQAMALQAFQAGAISDQTMRDFLDLTPAQRAREDARTLARQGTGGVSVDPVSPRSRTAGDSAGIPPESPEPDSGGGAD